MEQLSADIVAVCKQLYGTDVSVDMTRPDEQFGDYATNVALQLAKPLAKPPREIATQIADQLQERGIDASVAGPGFINVRLGDAVLVDEASSATRKPQLYGGKTVVAEYSDLNAFKQAHVGHLYTTIVGDVLSRLYEAAGAQVHRVNFGGDVGLHVAKNMWAILRFLGGENPEGLEQVSGDLRQRMAWLSARYVEGSQAYDSDEAAKAEIISTNRRVYDLHDQDDHSSAFAHIYWTCREWSYEYFKLFYDDLQVSQFERYYPESVTAPEGLRVVLEQLQKGVYSRSDGAVVFDGEQYGLHTRVFINSQGLPTYETKDVGLSIQKWRDYQFDESLIITGSDIVEYMKVVLKSIEQFEPQLAERTKHLTHGNVKLAGGVKMSSRLGNGLIPEDVLTAARAANRAATGKDDESAVLAAVKYAFLRGRLGTDIIYDAKESVSIHGNSGPYLQYAHARACSILRKATAEPRTPADLSPDERSLVRKMTEYPSVFGLALNEHMPHHICTYLYELAQLFNHFYEHNRVIDDPRQAERLRLVAWYTAILRDGLGLLGIDAPENM